MSDIRQSEAVFCQVCRVSFPGREFDTHDGSQVHRARVSALRLTLAIRKVDPTYGACRGTCIPLHGNRLIDEA